MINRAFYFHKNAAEIFVVVWALIGSLSASAQESGKQIFLRSCAACHSVGAGRLVGPDLAGVNDKRPEEWLLRYIKSSQSLVKSGDRVAVELFEQFNKIPMPDQALSDPQIRLVLAHIKETGSARTAGKDGAAGAVATAGATPGATAGATPAATSGVTPGATTTAASAATAASSTDPNPDQVRRGQGLFDGTVRFANGGPSCNACHHVTHDALLGGGVLAAELTLVFSRIGKQGISAMLGSTPFPVMQAAYAGKALAEEEITALVGFLQHVDQEHSRQMPKEWGWRMFSAGTGGVVVLLGIFALAGRRRKKQCVNLEIYQRQVRSE